MAVLSVLRNRLGILLTLALASVALAGVAALPQPPGGHPAVVSLAGSPHLWFSDHAGQLHWAGDTRALAGREIPWSNRIEVSRSELCALPADRLGNPWLSAGLLKQGDPIYLVKWETDWAQPQLLHIRSLRDVEALGINERNYGDLVYDVPTWEARYGFSVAALERGVMVPVCAPPPTPTPTPTATPKAGSTGGSTAAPPAPTSGGTRLTVSNIGRNTATLILWNYPGSWYYQYTAPAGGTCSSSPVQGSVASVTSLDPTTTYTFQAYSDSSCSTVIATASSFTTPEKSLTWVSITATAVTLTIAGHSGGWYYQADQAPHTNCSNVVTAGNNAVSLTGLTTNTAYTYTAYSDATCSTVIAATERFKTYNPRLAASLQTATTAVLTLHAWSTSADGNWYYQADKAPHNATCTGPESSNSVSLSGLSVNTRYTYTAYTDSNCTTAIVAAQPFTTRNPSLAVSNVGATTATLTISNWDVDTQKDGYWYYQRTSPSGDTTCHEVSTTTAAPGLTKSTRYTYTAYSDGNCDTANQLATASAFTTLTPALAAAQSGAVDVTLTLTNWATADGNWFYQDDQNQSCSGPVTAPTSGTTSTTTATNVLDDVSKTYVFTAYSDSNCDSTEAIAAAPGLTPVTMLVASNVGATFADLTLAPHTGDWYYQANKAPHTSCSNAQNAFSPTSLTGLTMNTRYTYTAYTDSNCTTAIATSKPFTTKNPALTASAQTATTATLTISNWDVGNDGYWYYQRTSPSGDTTCHEMSETTTSLTNLTANTTYKYRGYGDSNCTTAITAELSFATLTPSLAASNVGATTATLTISNWDVDTQKDGEWYYQRTSPSGDTTCHQESATTTSLTGLSVNTRYTYTAYSDSNCTTAIATASAFTTLTPALAAAQSGADVTLTLTNWATADGNWYYQDDQNNNCSSDVSAPTSGTTSTTTATNVLTDASLTYVFTAYNDSGCDSLKAIAAAPGLTPVATLAASNIGTTSADLTLSLHTGDWYYKADQAPHNTCSTVVSAGTSDVSLTGLTASTTYTYTAYSDNTCNTVIVAAAPFTTTSTYSLAVTAGILSAKLTFSGWTGNWYYQHDGASATCSTVVTGDNATATGLSENTSYTFTAYSDSSCSTAIVAAAAATTVNMDISVTKKDNHSLYVRLSDTTAWNTIVDGDVWSFRIVGSNQNLNVNVCTDATVSNPDPAKGSLIANTIYTVSGYIGRNCQGTAFESTTFHLRN